MTDSCGDYKTLAVTQISRPSSGCRVTVLSVAYVMISFAPLEADFEGLTHVCGDELSPGVSVNTKGTQETICCKKEFKQS